MMKKNNNFSNEVLYKLNKLPEKSGVYLMYNSENEVIYVGKAKNLKNRVTQYFLNTKKHIRVQKMVSNIYNFDYIITNSEDDALILECNLIKKYMPKYNVLLKDSKSYPYIAIDFTSEFPRLEITRNISKNKKYFGPYPVSFMAKAIVKYLNEKFKLIRCHPFKILKKPCIYYDIKQCNGPCVLKETREEYLKKIQKVISILNGSITNIFKEIEKEMYAYSKERKYELANEMKNLLLSIKRAAGKKVAINLYIDSFDAFSMARKDDKICVYIIKMRQHKIQKTEQCILENMEHLEDERILQSFIYQYYLNEELPEKIFVDENVDINKKALIRLVLENNPFYSYIDEDQINLIISNYKRNENNILEMARTNALQVLSAKNVEDKKIENIQMLEELKEKLNLKNIPLRIESYDISHTFGENAVGSMVVISNGNLDKNLYRLFKIKEKNNMQNDFGAMKEILKRRLKYINEESKKSKDISMNVPPDLILVDGGIIQIHAILDILKEEKNESIEVFGLIKNDHHQTRGIISKDGEMIDISQNLKNYVTLLQDEVHNFAINYHRKLNEKIINVSILNKIEGVGNKRKMILLEHFKTIENISSASVEEIKKLKIPENVAKNILMELNSRRNKI